MSERKITIEKLAGSSNYETWVLTMRALLRARNLWNSVMGRYDVPPATLEEVPAHLLEDKTTEDLHQARERLSEMRNQIANEQIRSFDIIVCECKPEVLFHIADLESGQEAWAKLREVYGCNTDVEKMHLMRAFWTLTLVEGAPMQPYLDEVQQIASRLQRYGEPLSDRMIMIKLVSFLPPSYETCASGLLSMQSTKQECIQSLQAEAKRRSNPSTTPKPQHQAMDVDTEPALAITTLKCHYCCRTGHKQVECRTMKTDQSNGIWNPRDMIKERRPKNASFASTERALQCSHHTAAGPWVLDSGAAKHFCSDRAAMRNMTAPRLRNVLVADGASQPVEGWGSAVINTVVDGVEFTLTIPDVHFAPALKQNLLSVSALAARGNKVDFTPNHATVIDRAGVTVLMAQVMNGLYVVQGPEAADMALSSSSTGCNITLWHQRLAHVNPAYLRKMPDLCLGINVDSQATPTVCRSCLAGHQARKPLSKAAQRRTEAPLELVHSDIWGPAPTQTPSHKRYYASFTDDHSRYSVVYLLAKKSDFASALADYHAMVETQLGTKLKAIRFDNAGENIGNAVKDFLRTKGILIDAIPPHTPPLNGVAERLNRTLAEKIRSLLHQSGLPPTYWGEALQTATYAKNVSPTKHHDVTPYQLWWGTKPNIGHLRTFGCRAHVHVKTPTSKLDSRTTPGILLGHVSHKEYKVLTKRGIIRSRDVVFEEQVFPSNAAAASEASVPTPLHEFGNRLVPGVADIDYAPPSPTPPAPPAYVSTHVNINDIVNSAAHALLTDTDADEPKTYQDAVSGPDADKWIPAIQEEYQSLTDNQTFELVDPPSGGCPLVGTKWLFKRKRDATGAVVRYKARLVAQGFSQTKGVDYNETFASVAKFTTVRFIFALAAIYGLYQTQMDVKTAFLYGAISEFVYTSQIQGFIDSAHPTMILRFRKALYGLRQAPRAWYDTLTSALRLANFTRSHSDFSLFLRFRNGQRTFILFWVDDVIVTATSQAELDDVRLFLNTQFTMTDLGAPHYFIGMQIEHDRAARRVTLHQATYLNKVLARFLMESTNPVSTPSDINTQHQLSSSADTPDSSFPYAQAVGSLIYLAVVTRPDIAHAVGVVSRFMANPTTSHVTAVKRIFKYLRGTAAAGLTYSPSKSCKLIGFCDADYANCPLDRRSVGGFVFMFGGASISWSSKKQSCVANSTTDAEYMALSQAAREALWLRKLAKDLHVQVGTTTINCDSSGAVAIAYNPKNHHRTKHIDVIHHFIREQVEEGNVSVVQVTSKEQLADVLTKALPRTGFTVLARRMLGSVGHGPEAVGVLETEQ